MKKQVNMDRGNRHRNGRNGRNGKKHKVRKAPKVPIKTYRWEDIRRSRKRGGYPWTYLYKPPFNEKVDPEQFTMEALRRSKSASTMGAKSEGVEISEVSSFAESGKTTPSFLHTEFITEPQEDPSAKNSRAGSVDIEEVVEDEDKNFEDDVQVKEFHTESIEGSSDNISQYLDKEERGPSNSKKDNKEERLTEDKNGDSGTDKDRGKRAQSEETGQRKRKLSAESSYSRYSLSKLGVMKKLREAKDKIKVPKISFPTKKNPRNKRSSPPKDSNQEDKPKKEAKQDIKKGKKENKKSLEPSRLRKDENPVYIRIPLKPPPGETDEFSHLEFESLKQNGLDEPKKSNGIKSDESDDKEPKKSETTEPTAINDNSKVEPKSKENESEKAEAENTIRNKENLPFSKLERGPRVTKKPPIKINPAFKQFLKDVRSLKDKEMEENASASTVEDQKKPEKMADQEKDATKPSTEKMDVDLDKTKTVLSKQVSKETEPQKEEEMELDLEEQQCSDTESKKEDPFERLFHARDKRSTESPYRSTTQDTPPAGTSRDVRSKSAEPQRKRASSIGSSYSRKSLSNLGIMKKLKEASAKIKNSFSMGSLRRKESSKDESKKPKKDKVKKDQKKKESDGDKNHKKPKETAVVKPGQLESPRKSMEPVYIHIPLKPPPGETDEFSHLEFESLPSEVKEKKPDESERERTDSLDSVSPTSPVKNDVQFIFLTPPSDDEILDEKVSEIPETPSSEDIVFFGSLKKLAQHVVDELHPETMKRNLETVREESVSDKGSIGEDSNGKKDDDKEETITFTETKTEDEKSETESVGKTEEVSVLKPKNSKTKRGSKKKDNNDETLKEDKTAPDEKKEDLKSVVKKEDKKNDTVENKDTEHKKPTDEKKEDVSSEEMVKKEQKQSEKMTIDIEDGLNEPTKPEELKSVLKHCGETSPILKKKVSFKRKAKVTKDDGGYEPVGVPKEEDLVDPKRNGEKTNIKDRDSATVENLLVTGSSVEEKSSLDNLMQDSALEKDKDKWSHINDHEYEPISPPDEATLKSPSTISPLAVVDADTEPKVVISATEILEQPPAVDEKKKSFFSFGRRKSGQDKQRIHGGSSGGLSKSSQGEEELQTEEIKKASESPNKIQVALKQKTDQLKSKTSELGTKIRNIKAPKMPEIKKPQFRKPDFKKFKIERPKINLNLPKIPDTTTIHLRNISLPGTKKTTEKRTIETRQFSTESNVGDSDTTTKRSKFDFDFRGTFPRFRKKKKQNEQSPAFATVPRVKKDKDEEKRMTDSGTNSSIRIPLHSEDSMDAEEKLQLEEDDAPIRTGYEDREMSEDIDRSSHTRYDRNIAIEDEYERENQEINQAEYLNRWQHGNFNTEEREREEEVEPTEEEIIVGQLIQERFKKITPGYSRQKHTGSFLPPREPSLEERYYDNQSETLEDRLRKDEGRLKYLSDEEEFGTTFRRHGELITDLDNLEDDDDDDQEYSSEGSGRLPRRGRLGKIDINSDEFFVVHEIQEGLRTPVNALAQMNEYDPIGSNRSLPQVTSKRKPIKKPKRKKTPHVSQERIQREVESFEDSVPPSRPKRRSKKNKKLNKEQGDTVVPYREIIPGDEDLHGQRLEFPRESIGVLGDDEGEQEFEMYENEKMKGKEQPEIHIIDPYKRFAVKAHQMRDPGHNESSELPSAPPRKHRSLKSLTASENESLLADKFEDYEKNLKRCNIEDYIIPTDQLEKPPSRPNRSRSQTSSLSRISLPPSQRDTDSILTDEAFLVENQPIPSYLIENQNYKQHFKGNEAPSYLQDEVPCVEEPCIQDVRDYMGYAIVDKNKPPREPPLPPPRTPPRRRKRQIEPDQKFATVPRNLAYSQPQSEPPIRPLRNYSTLTQVKNVKKKDTDKDSHFYDNEDENKENIVKINKYKEIDDDINKDLISGEVVQKMRQRPLPAPPRPPRKPRSFRRSLQDITSKENIIPSPTPSNEIKPIGVQEETVSTQTEPLPEDFICEDIPQEPTDTIVTPRLGPRLESEPSPSEEPVESETVSPIRTETRQNEQTEPQIRRELITPTVYSYEETVTHGALLVEPLNGAKILPDHQLSRERIIPVTKDSDEETSEIPESFKKLKSPDNVQNKPEEPQKPVEVLKTEKLQVSDLDVDRLRVNQLLANKILVSEIDASTIQTSEIQGKSGPLRVSEIELPPGLLEEIVRNLENREATEVEPHKDDQEEQQKKTSSPECPPQPNEDPLIPTEPVESNEDPIEPVQDFDYSLEQQILDQNFSEPQVHDLNPSPPLPPPRSYTLESIPPDAPPRTLRRSKDSPESPKEENLEQENNITLDEQTDLQNRLRAEMLEPEVDDEPPPRPPQPLEGLYMPSQPPASFYALRAKQYVEGVNGENIPVVPRRKRHQRSRSRPVSRSRSTSDESSSLAHPRPRSVRRYSDPSIPELTGRLIQACGNRANNAIKRLIYHWTENILRNADGKQDLHVIMIILLVLIAGLILLGYGEDRTVVHLHHWEFFNPPKDL